MIMLKDFENSSIGGLFYKVEHSICKTNNKGNYVTTYSYNEARKLPNFKSVELEHERKLEKALRSNGVRLGTFLVHTLRNNIDITTTVSFMKNRVNIESKKPTKIKLYSNRIIINKPVKKTVVISKQSKRTTELKKRLGTFLRRAKHLKRYTELTRK